MEKRYESDLTKKEKRKLEYEKIKGMGFKKKIEYFCAYYKWVLVVVICIGFAANLFWTMYSNSRMNTVLAMAIIDSNGYYANIDQEELEQQLLELVGTGDKYDQVVLDISASSADQYEAGMKMMVVVSVGGNDVMICNQETYDKYNDLEAFQDWKEILGDDYEKYEKYMTNGVPDLSKSIKWVAEGMTSYTPAYAAVMVDAKNVENVVKMLDYYFFG